MFETVRTRFAPSPTGYLHVGGARTALFNYLLARRLGGKFILRIEDTDQTRNIAHADQKLMDDLRWLGLQWDEGPGVGGVTATYYQSQRLERYRAVARDLIDAGHAYYAFDTREELDALRAEAQRAKRNFRYADLRRPSQSPSHAQSEDQRAAGRTVVVRLRMPEHDFTVRDTILGEVTRTAAELDDFVLLKGDGWPTYHFAVVVDDQDMQVTHVLRGQEHLMNTPNHMALQELLGYRTPVYAHLPIILNMDGSKMSKREKDRAVRGVAEQALAKGMLDEGRLRALTGAVADEAWNAWRAGDAQLDGDSLQRLARALHVALPEIQIHDFRASGYLPEVLVNFIALLGWSAGDDREKYTLAELCAAFSAERVGKTNARFDRQKLLNFNTTALAAAGSERRLRGLRDYLAVNADSPLAALADDVLSPLLAMCEGIRTFRDVETKCNALFIADEALAYDEDAIAKHLRKNESAGFTLLAAVRTELDAVEGWSAGELERVIREYAERSGQKLGNVAQPLRIAITGGTVSPPMFETLALLGRQKSLARIDLLLKRA